MECIVSSAADKSPRFPPCSLGRSTEEGVPLQTAAPGVGPRQPPAAFSLGESLGMVGPIAQLLEQLPSIPTSPLVKGDRLHPTDSWSDFSEDLSTMVIVHCCKKGQKHRSVSRDLLTILFKVLCFSILLLQYMQSTLPRTNLDNFTVHLDFTIYTNDPLESAVKYIVV